MKVLVATKESQGKRKNDFCWVPEGEIVHFAFECDSDRNPDGPCGCRRSMVGIDCTKSTTTMKVKTVGATKDFVTTKLKLHYIVNWKMDPERAEKVAKTELKDLQEVVKGIPEGTILEKRGDSFLRRGI
jgi:hypothetical protein